MAHVLRATVVRERGPFCVYILYICIFLRLRTHTHPGYIHTQHKDEERLAGGGEGEKKKSPV